MSALSRRVDRLEARTGQEKPCAFLFVPSSYSQDEKTAALSEMRAELPEPCEEWVICSEHSDTHRVMGIGLLSELLDYVARHGRRLGDKPSVITPEQEKQK